MTKSQSKNLQGFSKGSQVAQMVGCWTNNPRVVVRYPVMPTVSCGITCVGKMDIINLDCASLHPGKNMGTQL